MSYIRDRREELTGYQEHAPWQSNIDLQCDFVMVYGIDATMPERVRQFREKGYVVHLMTGVAWGEYQDYLNGEFDGRKHWDESQTARSGKPILHGIDVPYMVPAISFSDYLTEKLKVAVDAGVEAIHMEEPEFWDYCGYSEAFKREYLLYYREDWRPPHTGLDARYKCSKLKAYLYARSLGRIGAALKEYALVKYGRALRFYVPTHSLVNYTQWKIMSPEGALIDIPPVDGYIAQVWTGTSRASNAFEGVIKERTFETAYLEYGIMQELTRGTGRRMWFLHDPIEDNPEYTWEDYRRNYLKTAVASLLHPAICNYEICPWPRRVFDGVFPRKAGLAGGTIPTTMLPGAKPITPEYATLLNGMVQLFGDMDQSEYAFEGVPCEVGVLMSDSGLFQRSYPDGVVTEDERARMDANVQSFTNDMHAGIDRSAESRDYLHGVLDDDDRLRAFIQSGAFPNFFGMALPLLKYGLPVRPVQLDNVRRFPSYLDGYKVLVLSYEYMKPESPDVNNALAAWVRGGGRLFYIGDGSDPYHGVDGWWNRSGAKYDTPAAHLFDMLGLNRGNCEGMHTVGEGRAFVWNIAPAKLSADAALADEYRGHMRALLAGMDCDWTYTNRLTLRRGPYIISAAMDETRLDTTSHTFAGLFADMLENDYRVITEKTIGPDENAILFDFSRITGIDTRIIGCSARVFELDVSDASFAMRVKASDKIRAFIRIRLPHPPTGVSARTDTGSAPAIECQWDEFTRTALLSYASDNRELAISGSFEAQ